MRSHRPPSKAGIGSTFIHASDTEISAVRNAKLAGPAEVNAGNNTPIIPTGPDTESPTDEIASCPLCRTFASGLNSDPTPDTKFHSIIPSPLKVSPVICTVNPAPTTGADHVEYDKACDEAIVTPNKYSASVGFKVTSVSYSASPRRNLYCTVLSACTLLLSEISFEFHTSVPSIAKI